MTLLYLLEDDFAIDDDGVRWTQEPSGAWRPIVESRPQADLRLIWSATGCPGSNSAPPRLSGQSDWPQLASA